jgi:hypothetical protein
VYFTQLAVKITERALQNKEKTVYDTHISTNGCREGLLNMFLLRQAFSMIAATANHT